MAKTYTLQSTACKGGIHSGWAGDWNNFYTYGDGTGRRIGQVGSNYYAVYYAFDQSVLANLKTKSIKSVTLTVTISGAGTGIPGGSSDLYPIRAKKTNAVGSGSGSAAWQSTGSNLGYVRRASGNSLTLLLALDATIPTYGYTIGAGAAGYEQFLELASSATLTVVTNETDKYTVSYNAGGGTGAPAAQAKEKDVALTLSSDTPTWAGHAFVRWDTKPDGTGTSYSPGGSYTANADVTLSAVWSVATYTISFNANGGSGTPASQTKDHGVALTLSDTVPTRTGYNFSGWNTSADGSGTSYQAGGEYLANADVTLYAIWTKKTFSITYDANGHGTAPTAQSKEYGDSVTIAAAITGVIGSSMLEWNTDPDGMDGTSYQPGDTYSADEDVVLYAIWSVATYTVTFNADGGTVTPATKSVAWGQKYGELPTPTKAGETFYGWFDPDDVLVTENSMVELTANVTLTAAWSIRSMVRVKGSDDALHTGAVYVKGDDGNMYMGIVYVKGSDGSMHING